METLRNTKSHLINFVTIHVLFSIDFRPLIFGQNDGNGVRSVTKKDKEGVREKKMIDDYTNG